MPVQDFYDGLSAVLVAERPDASFAALEAAGVRVRARIEFGEARERLNDFQGIDLLVIDAEAAPNALIEPVLARAGAMMRERQISVIATLAIDQIDAAVPHLLGPLAQLLCDPSDADRAAAMALACAQAAVPGRPPLLRVMDDARREGEAARLQRLNEEVARIAETLVRLTRGEDFGRRSAVQETGSDYAGAEGGDPGPATPHEIRAAIRARRMRAQFFTGDLFADPAWDMLLDLFAAQLEERSVSVSSLCIAAAVPPTTALRWIGTLHQAGLFERRADPADRRRAYIALSPKGFEGMREYVAAVKRAGLNLV